MFHTKIVHSNVFTFLILFESGSGNKLNVYACDLIQNSSSIESTLPNSTKVSPKIIQYIDHEGKGNFVILHIYLIFVRCLGSLIGICHVANDILLEQSKALCSLQ